MKNIKRCELKLLLINEQAVYKALLDRGKNDVPTVIMVVGAGRGPIVNAALQAAAEAKKPVKMYAIEKNPNAVLM